MGISASITRGFIGRPPSQPAKLPFLLIDNHYLYFTLVNDFTKLKEKFPEGQSMHFSSLNWGGGTWVESGLNKYLLTIKEHWESF